MMPAVEFLSSADEAWCGGRLHSLPVREAGGPPAGIPGPQDTGGQAVRHGDIIMMSSQKMNLMLNLYLLIM